MKPENQEFGPQAKLEELTDNFKAYITTIYELSRLRLVDKLALATANITVYIIRTILAVFTILFTSVGVALWLNDCLQNTFSGFFIVGGIYFIITLWVTFSKNSGTKKAVSNAVIKSAMDQ